MHFDPLLNFSAHCEKQVNKGNKILDLIRRSYSYLNETSLVKLYTSLVRSHLEHANKATLYRPQFTKKGLSVAGRRAEKSNPYMVPNLNELRYQYEDRLARLNLPSLYIINNTWNRLLSHIVDAPSINSFKARLDKHWTQCQYV